MENNIYQEHGKAIAKQAADFLPILKGMKEMFGEEEVLKYVRTSIDLIGTKVESQISCKKGCSFCCHDSIYATGIEARVIRKHVQNSDILIDHHLLGKQKKGYDKLTWKEKQCVMLKDGECQIYEHRPLICRTHNSTMDPSQCNKELNPGAVTRDLKTLESEGLLMALTMLDGDGKMPEIKSLADQL